MDEKKRELSIEEHCDLLRRAGFGEPLIDEVRALRKMTEHLDERDRQLADATDEMIKASVWYGENVDIALDVCQTVIRRVHRRDGFFQGWKAVRAYAQNLQHVHMHVKDCIACRHAFAFLQTTP